MQAQRERPLSIAILALGGQGGGVLCKWLVEVAERSGYLAQSTFLAGVAQRTGATIYCVEMFSKARADALGKTPVFTPYPIPGDVDIVIVGEMAETGRALQKGFVTPNTTTLIASSHRIYSVQEKSALGDGMIDQTPIMQAATHAARKFICFDMQAVADEAGCAISAVLLGALCGSRALPFEELAFSDAIRQSGRSVNANLAGFMLGFDKASQDKSCSAMPVAADVLPPAKPQGENGKLLAGRIQATFPSEVRNIALHGALRALEYQDLAYAQTYLDRVAELLALERAGSGRQFALTVEVARQLALQMCYEDTLRVADLKTRSERLQRVRAHLSAAPNQPAYVIEYFHPRFEEICDTLPAWFGARLIRSRRMRRWTAPLFKQGRNIATTKIVGFLTLYWLAKFRRWRRMTYRFQVQTQLIADWLQRVRQALEEDYDYALAIAQLIEIVKGYGDTYQRGLSRYRETLDMAAANVGRNGKGADLVRQLRVAALADEEGKAFNDAIALLANAHE